MKKKVVTTSIHIHHNKRNYTLKGLFVQKSMFLKQKDTYRTIVGKGILTGSLFTSQHRWM